MKILQDEEIHAKPTQIAFFFKFKLIAAEERILEKGREIS